MRRQSDSGAAAVEFALVAMVLVALLVGILEFGRLWAVQGNLALAARDAARQYAITNDSTTVEPAFDAAFTWRSPDGVLTITPSLESAGTPGDPNCRRTVTAEYDVESLTGFFGDSWKLTAEGSMRCNG